MNAITVKFTVPGTARASNGGFVCERPERVIKGAGAVRTVTRPDSGDGARNAALQTKK